MEHARQPSTIYDLTTLASAVARYNVRGQDSETLEQVRAAHAEAIRLVGAESAHKAPVPHTDKELLSLSEGFAMKILILLDIAEQTENVYPDMAADTRKIIGSFGDTLRKLEGSPEWMIDPREIDDMFGITVADDHAKKVMHAEITDLRDTEAPTDIPDAIQTPISEDEANAVFQGVRRSLFKADPIDPLLYIEPTPERHYLFWTPTSRMQECAVPQAYSVADHFRFHSPHNDAHLSHLRALDAHGTGAYMDYMDERAYFEAIAVHSEWQIRHALRNDDGSLKYELHNALSETRRQSMSADAFADWMVAMRAYECRLRAARLVADVLTIDERLPFHEMLERSISLTGVSRRDAEDEARKYYLFPGLGAVYTLGYRQLLDHGITNPMDAIYQKGSITRTWKEFHQKHDI